MKKYKPTQYKQEGKVTLLKAKNSPAFTNKDYGWKKIINNIII